MTLRRVPAPLLGVVALLAGCGEPLYLARLGWTQARILLRREPIDGLLERPTLDPALRDRLRLVVAVRSFARDDLGLRVGDSYTTFAEVDGDATVWVLSAAHRDRLEPYTWWFPIVGRVPYRGFFARSEAEAGGETLASRDLDVEVRPAVAFSTLGWFADPLLSTTAQGSPAELVETVIHELFHATLYVPGAAAFNESAATFAGHRGAIAFFCAGSGADAAACARARDEWAMTRARARVLVRLGSRLRSLYARHPPAATRERARASLARAAADTLAARRLGSRTELVPPNNARLLGALLYATELDAFDALAPRDADLGPALQALIASARDAPEPFAAVRSLVPTGS